MRLAENPVLGGVSMEYSYVVGLNTFTLNVICYLFHALYERISFEPRRSFIV
jgi:hypothetical protein